MDFSAVGDNPSQTNKCEGSGKMDELFNEFIVVKSQLQPWYQVVLPAKMRAWLPSNKIVDAVLKSGNKEWKVIYHGDTKTHRAYIGAGWKLFAIQNNLKVGDLCIFKLTECSSSLIKFDVEIIKRKLSTNEYEAGEIKTQFNVVKSHLEPWYQVVLPAKMRALLPSSNVDVFLEYGNKEWKVVYHGDTKAHSPYLGGGWKSFATENKLKVGDTCIFKLTECSTSLIKFEVQILEHSLVNEKHFEVEPLKYQEQHDSSAESSERMTQPLLKDTPRSLFVFVKTQVQGPYAMVLSAKMRALLPPANVPVVLNYGSKSWNMRYLGESASCQRFDYSGWKSFVTENKIKAGDGCVFELIEYSPQGIEFRVQILDGELPSKILQRSGTSRDAPITID